MLRTERLCHLGRKAKGMQLARRWVQAGSWQAHRRLAPQPGSKYPLQEKERVCVPPPHALEQVPFETSTHFALFVQPSSHRKLHTRKGRRAEYAFSH